MCKKFRFLYGSVPVGVHRWDDSLHFIRNDAIKHVLWACDDAVLALVSSVEDPRLSLRCRGSTTINIFCLGVFSVAVGVGSIEVSRITVEGCLRCSLFKFRSETLHEDSHCYAIHLRFVMDNQLGR